MCMCVRGHMHSYVCAMSMVCYTCRNHIYTCSLQILDSLLFAMRFFFFASNSRGETTTTTTTSLPIFFSFKIHSEQISFLQRLVDYVKSVMENV